MNYNLSSTHPIIPTSKFDSKPSTFKKYLTYLHRPTSTKELDVDFKLCNNYNIDSVALYSYRFPPTKRINNISSALNNNIITFQIINPSDPGEDAGIDYTIYTILSENSDKYYTVSINDGCYTNDDLKTLLEYKFNLSVSVYIQECLTTSANSSELSTFDSDGGYTSFSVSYNDMENKFSFGNKNDQFILTNSYTFETHFACAYNKVLPIMLGMDLIDITASNDGSGYCLDFPSTSLIGYIDFLYLFVKQINFIDITRDNKELYQHYFAQMPLKEIENSNHVFTYSTNVPANYVKNTPNTNMNTFNFRFEDSLGRTMDVGNLAFEITLELGLA